jgi:hypothetical protein
MGLARLSTVATVWSKFTALEITAMYNHDELTKDLLSWWDGWTSEVTLSALWRSATCWNVKVVRVMIEAVQFEQNQPDFAMMKSCGPKVMVDELGDPKRKVEEGIRSQQEMVRLLLEAGASPNSQDSVTGTHAIHIAAGYLETTGAFKASP